MTIHPATPPLQHHHLAPKQRRPTRNRATNHPSPDHHYIHHGVDLSSLGKPKTRGEPFSFAPKEKGLTHHPPKRKAQAVIAAQSPQTRFAFFYGKLRGALCFMVLFIS
ncbi:hypothetical protein [Desulfarculus baarsii]|uniref:hypothetical protein n=1 Tax=Desulfarculus baarsii TaxID=453230 RepID=UPI0016517C96|nr:hypothetical protein [Desulfarculus baarsii]